jgi:acetyl/propionyl-CoA carboxylase alpha subunit
MKRALSEFKIVGVETNLQFHVQAMDNPYFRAGQIDTDFLEKHFDPQYEPPAQGEDAALIAAALLSHLRSPAVRQSGADGSANGRTRDGVSIWRTGSRVARLRGGAWRAS